MGRPEPFLHQGLFLGQGSGLSAPLVAPELNGAQLRGVYMRFYYSGYVINYSYGQYSTCIEGRTYSAETLSALCIFLNSYGRIDDKAAA